MTIRTLLCSVLALVALVLSVPIMQTLVQLDPFVTGVGGGTLLLGMFPFQRDPAAPIVPVEGRRIFSRLINKVQTQFVELTARGLLTIGVANADSILNRGSIWSAFDEVGIDGDGEDKQLYYGPVLRFISEMSSPSALSAKRVTSINIGATTLEESARIYFAHPFAAIPRETALMERNSGVKLEAFVKMAANAGLRFVNPAPTTTSVLSGVAVDVTHVYDAQERVRPLFIPMVRQIIADVPGANPQLKIELKTSTHLRGLVISQETAVAGEVGDIINSLAIRGDFASVIGPAQEDFDDLLLGSEYEFGGAVVSSNRSHLGFNFQQHGRLSNVLSPDQGSNLRIEANVQPSVVADAGASRIRVTLIELVRDPAVVDPTLPIPV